MDRQELAPLTAKHASVPLMDGWMDGWMNGQAEGCCAHVRAGERQRSLSARLRRRPPDETLGSCGQWLWAAALASLL